MRTFTSLCLVLFAASLQAPLSARAHDLTGAKQEARHVGAYTPAARAKRAIEAQNYNMLRDVARGSRQPNFNIKEHLQSRGFAGDAPNVVFGIGEKTARWPGLFQLNVCFFDGPPAARAQVMAIFAEVLSHTTLSAVNLGKCGAAPANIRISFATGEGYWSVVGIAAQRVDQSQPTMGLDGLGSGSPLSQAGKGVVRHEILHSVGLEHEHQRPDVDCKFKSFKDIAQIIGWSEADVKTNFERLKPSSSLVMTEFDRDSDMLYQLKMEYFTDPASPCRINEANTEISPLDVATLKLMYPPMASGPSVLNAPPGTFVGK